MVRLNINGLTQKDMRNFKEIMIKANDEQLFQLREMIDEEVLQRIQLEARQDVGDTHYRRK